MIISTKDADKSLPVYWKSKQIVRTVHSSKDSETLNMAKLVDDSVYVARQLELLLFGAYSRRLPVRLFTDSEPTLESIASTKPIETKRLRNQVQELKEVLMTGEVSSYAWLGTKDMLADVMMKEVKMPRDLEKLLHKNILNVSNSSVNEVKAFGDELRMTNVRNRNADQNSKETEEVEKRSRGNVDLNK